MQDFPLYFFYSEAGERDFLACLLTLDNALMIPAKFILVRDSERKNLIYTPNNAGINNGNNESAGVIQKPQIKEIVIPRPIAEGKNRPKPIEKEGFVF